jgi:hypothetical protein
VQPPVPQKSSLISLIERISIDRELRIPLAQVLESPKLPMVNLIRSALPLSHGCAHNEFSHSVRSNLLNMQTKSLFKMRNLLGLLKSRRLSALANAPARFLVLLFLGLMLLVIFSGVQHRSKETYIDNPNEQVISASAFIKTFPEIKETAAYVDLGLYLDSLYELDMSQLTFKARGWLWYKWTKTPLIEGKFDPGQLGSFNFNSLDQKDVYEQISSKVHVTEADGQGETIHWNETAFDVKLAAPTISLKNYPFDHQRLSILVTDPVHETVDLMYRIEQFRLPPNLFNISGYKLDGISYADQVRVYTSNFEDSSEVSLKDGSADTQSQAAFNIFISRNALTSVLEYVLPIFVVSFLAVSVVGLGLEYWEAKITTPPAAILSLIFLQNTFGQALPRLSYMTSMDLMFLIAYLVCMLSFTDALFDCLFSDSKNYRGIYGKLACAALALSPLIMKVWLSVPI